MIGGDDDLFLSSFWKSFPFLANIFIMDVISTLPSSSRFNLVSYGDGHFWDSLLLFRQPRRQTILYRELNHI